MKTDIKIQAMAVLSLLSFTSDDNLEGFFIVKHDELGGITHQLHSGCFLIPINTVTT